MGKARTWAELIQPTVNRLDVAITFKATATFNPDGAQALKSLLKEMARVIDEEIERRDE